MPLLDPPKRSSKGFSTSVNMSLSLKMRDVLGPYSPTEIVQLLLLRLQSQSPIAKVHHLPLFFFTGRLCP